LYWQKHARTQKNECASNDPSFSNADKELGMGHIPGGVLIWSLKRYMRNTNLWDRVCFRCKRVTPVFEYEHRDEQERPLFHYLCEECAQKKLAEWLQCAQSPDYVHLGYQTDFDIAIVSYEQKNDGETLTLTRWSAEQRRRRLQGANA
jgi:hypothetical protein